jgi:hypothetical protein
MRIGVKPGPFWINQCLLGATVFLAAHNANWARWLFPVIALLNGALWVILSFTKPDARNTWPALLKTPLTILIPGLYFAVIGILFASRTGLDLTWPILATAAYGATFLVAAGLSASTYDLRPLFRSLTLAGVVICIEALAEMWARTPDPGWLLSPVRWWHDPGSFHTTMRMGMGSLPWASRLAALLNLIAACTMGLFSLAKRLWEKVLYGAAIGLFALGIFFSGTRSALIIMVAIMLVLSARKPGWGRRIAGGLGVLGVLMLAVMATMRRSPIRGDGSMRGRLQMWKLCVEMGRKYPLFGSGPNAFRKAWPAYATEHVYGFTGFQDPHSIYFLMLTDGGLVMLGMMASVVTGVMWESWKLFRSKLPTGSMTLLFGLGLGLLGVLVNDLVDISLMLPMMQLLAVILCGIVVGYRFQARKLQAAKSSG